MPPDFVPPFCSSRMLMRSYHRPINRVLFPIDLPSSIALLLQCTQDSLPNSCFLPAIKAAGDRAPRAVVVRQISPRRTGSQDPKDCIDNQTVIVCWTTHFWLLWRQQGIQLFPLLIREFSSSHPFSLNLFCKHGLVLQSHLRGQAEERNTSSEGSKTCKMRSHRPSLSQR